MALLGSRPAAMQGLNSAGEKGSKRPSPIVVAIADVETNAQALIKHVLTPAGVRARTERIDGPPPDVLVVDVTQLRGDPMGALRNWRERGDNAPAIILAAHIPPARLRDLFHLNVRDVLLKPYRPAELCEAIFELAESRSSVSNTQMLADRLDASRERTRQYAEEIKLLSEIGRAVATVGELDTILRRVAEAAAFVSGAEEANIYLVQPGTDELLLRASKQAGERHATLLRLRINDTLVGQVFHTGKPVLMQPTAEGSPVKVQTGFLVQSLVMVPLRVRDRMVGVLGVYNPAAARPFDEHHLTLLVSLADWTSVALEHAALVQQTQTTPAAAPEEAPTPARPSAVQETLTAAPASLIEGLEESITDLEPVLKGALGVLTHSQLEMLRSIHERLQKLQSMPIATLSDDQADQFVDLPALVNENADAMRGEAGRKGLSLTVEANPMSLFAGDRRRTSQVIEGLLTAAMRRTEQGRVLVRVRRFMARGGRTDKGIVFPHRLRVPDGLWSLVSVSDSSSGFSDDTQYALNSPAADPAAGKTGRGLSMGEVRMIAESLGGALWHEKTSDGPTIHFIVPVA